MIFLLFGNCDLLVDSQITWPRTQTQTQTHVQPLLSLHFMVMINMTLKTICCAMACYCLREIQAGGLMCIAYILHL